MSVFSEQAFDDHERVVFCNDAGTGLQAIIAIHSTRLGPAAGGCRLWRYASDDAALHDVLRLSQGMSYKNAMAGLKFGGGKAVILKSADFSGSDALYEKFGDFVEAQGGDYITAEDVGMSVDIMQTIAKRTRYVSGLPKKEGAAGGDPSPKTAFGIFRGILAAIEFRFGEVSLRGRRVAVQGVGNVGSHLCEYLADAGASLVVADIDERKTTLMNEKYGAEVVSLAEIMEVNADVLAPCALGAILNQDSIPKLRVAIVAGGANNQLDTAEDGRKVRDAGILYAPDYVINAGGIINVACEYYGSCNDEEVMNQVAAIGPRLTGIFRQSEESGIPTNEVADALARQIVSGDAA